MTKKTKKAVSKPKKTVPRKHSEKVVTPSELGSDKPRVLTPEIVFDEPKETPTESQDGDSVPFDPNENFVHEEDAEKPLTPALELPSLTSKGGLTPADPVARYMAELRRYPLLTREEEEALAKKYYETRDPMAAEKLVTSNLRFVVKIAAEYSRFGAKLIDLIQEGNVGLMHAVKEFNPYKGVRLITYAVWWIRGYIQEFLMRQYSMVRIGTTQNQRKLFYQLQREREELERLGPAALKQLSGRLGIPEDEVQDMQRRLSSRDVSLDRPVGDDDSSTLIDFQTDSGEVALDDRLGHLEMLELMKGQIERLRPSLSDRETYLLEHRILSDEPMTLQEIGDEWGVTREAVRQIEARLMGKIKAAVIAAESESG